MKELLMGNEAIALGALAAGVGFVSGYPGTPSTEVLETVAAQNPGNVYVEWSVNEKVALEAAAGAAYAGARAMVTMKQVGLSVASDPLMNINYVGVKGGLVLVVCDDPGPISSQTEQDTRHFAQYARVPVLDPESPEEAYQMIQDAFDYSEKYQTPVILRPTTRVCHSCATVDVNRAFARRIVEGFVKDSKWVIFPRLAYKSKLRIVSRESEMSEDFSAYSANFFSGTGKLGIVSGGISAAYAKNTLRNVDIPHKFLKIATPYPFPERLALDFLQGLERVLVLEELDPVIEDALIWLSGKRHIDIEIIGKRGGDMKNAGENTPQDIEQAIYRYLGIETEILQPAVPEPPTLAERPPVLCAGCPHRGSFYAVKAAMKGRKAVFCGDIGCYTLGNAAPLNMVDTCLCMGAGVTIAQGLERSEPDAAHFAFIGDSTFFHTGIPGVINAVYNQTDMILVVLDNSTTAMTGNQPHPGTGKTMMGDVAEKISIRKILEAVGVTSIQQVDPFDFAASKRVVEAAVSQKGVRAILFERPCIAVSHSAMHSRVNEDRCTGCQRCIRELGCPAVALSGKKVRIDPELCRGCGLCAQICPAGCIAKEDA